MDLEKKDWNLYLWIIIGGIMLVVISALDYLTGTELSFAFFYLAPIIILAWKVNTNAGIVMAMISTITSVGISIVTRATEFNIPVSFWNGLVRLGFFLTPVFLLQSLERQRREARLDYLTGTFNNRYFDELLQREVDRSARYGRHFTVVFLDTDNFKTINDTFGHAFGDSLLRSIGNGMRQYLRKTDIVARVGGDEFALLLPETGEKAAKVAVSNMVNRLTAELQAMHYPVTFSIGVLTLVAPNLSADQIIGLTDKMMYLVKNNGKNNVHYDIYKNTSDHAG